MTPNTTTVPSVKIASILTFLAPAIATISGGLVTWLFTNLHFLGIFNVTPGKLTQVIASGIVFAVTSGLTYAAAHFHWLPIVLKYHE